MDLYQKYIHLSRYSKWDEESRKRETWDETVRRYTDWLCSEVDPEVNIISAQQESILSSAIFATDIMPSMRAMMTAGKAAIRDNVCIYNCGYTPVESIKDFADIMYILMSGTGVGFSVERQHIKELPIIAETFKKTDRCITIGDSKVGWCESYLEWFSTLASGYIPDYDTSLIRPEGSRLHVMGGRASGSQPIIDLFEYTKDVVTNAKGRQLTSEEAHNICCEIARIVVVGGVRRSALISLSNLSDPRMRDIKKGAIHNRLYLANNSVAYTEKPDLSIFLQEIQSLYESKSGERGIFNRQAAKSLAEQGRRDPHHDFGTNPCSEIILRPRQFCNLTEAVIRPADTFDQIKEKVKLATILGTLQATQTKFPFIDKRWTENTEEERLLGVSLTGIMDHPVLNGSKVYTEIDAYGGGYDESFMLSEALEQLKEVAIETNKEWAELLGIPVSTAITCIKPSGTVSQLVDSASGIHDRFSPYYIRRVRSDIKDPITSMMIEIGVPHEPDVTNPATVVFSFPRKAPEGAVFTTAMEKLGQWLTYQKYWCEHKPSVTINYDDDEFLQLAAVIYAEFDSISGISLLPKDDSMYHQMPYEAITEDQYNIYMKDMPEDMTEESMLNILATYEKTDHTEGVQQLSCSAGVCEI